MTCVYSFDYTTLTREEKKTDDKSIIMHKASHQGNNICKPLIHFNSQIHLYTENSGCTFEVVFKNKKISVSTLCDGHDGYFASYMVTSIISDLFSDCIEKTNGDIYTALELLFAELIFYLTKLGDDLVNSKTTCNVMVFDSTEEKVYVASLGNSLSLRYRKQDGKYNFIWKSKEQDCTFPFRSIFSTKTPLIYVHEWTKEQVFDIWIQSSFSLLNSTLDSSLDLDSRLEEIAYHLDLCSQNYDVAYSLHSAQIESMLEKNNEHSKEWLEANIDDRLTKVFMW